MVVMENDTSIEFICEATAGTPVDTVQQDQPPLNVLRHKKRIMRRKANKLARGILKIPPSLSSSGTSLRALLETF